MAIDRVLLRPTEDENQTARLQLLGIEMLGELNNSHRVLAWFAMSSPIEEVRNAALDQLRRKPIAESVPVLLARMRMPLEVGVSARLQGRRVAVDYSFYREGPGIGHRGPRRNGTVAFEAAVG